MAMPVLDGWRDGWINGWMEGSTERKPIHTQKEHINKDRPEVTGHKIQDILAVRQKCLVLNRCSLLKKKKKKKKMESLTLFIGYFCIIITLRCDG